MTPTAWDFQNRLMAILNAGRQIGKSYVDVESGSLYRQVGGIQTLTTGCPFCCEVMRRMMRRGDSVLKEPSSEQGATLLIRYMV
jgi:hypothetical protein